MTHVNFIFYDISDQDSKLLMPNTTFEYNFSHIFLQTIRETQLGVKDVIKSNESTKVESVPIQRL
jgi:hypothetical protein